MHYYKLVDMDESNRAYNYKCQLFVEDMQPTHPTARDALYTTICSWLSNYNLPKWKCVLNTCAEFPGYIIPDEVKDEIDTEKLINFHVYCEYSRS